MSTKFEHRHDAGLKSLRVRPFRLVIVSRGYRGKAIKVRGKAPDYRGTHTPVELADWAVMGWTADQTAEPCRLEGSGTFLYPGALRALAAARAAFRDARVRQISLRTNQDRMVLMYNRWDDGRITCYRGEE